VRLHRHSACLLNQCPLMELSLARTQYKGDDTPGAAVRQTGQGHYEAIDRERFFWPLERCCGKRDNYFGRAEPDTGAQQNQRWR
jgi:hypothetical protein